MSDQWVLGVDIGGTNLLVAAVPTEGGEPVALRSQETFPERGGDATVADIAEMVEAVVQEMGKSLGVSREAFIGLGIGCPGPLDLDSGVVISSPNLGWNGYPIRDRIIEAVGFPVSLDNDANCATYGEWWQGAGKGAKSLFGVTVGTGIGGGYILDGRLLRGASGSAGEIGHTTINFAGRRCGCGNYGCLEAYTSGPSIAARAREGLEAGYESSLRQWVDGDLDAITALTVYDALMDGDEYAQEVMTETAKILGSGVANVVNTFNPEMVVIVGGVTRAGDHLFGPLRSEVRRRAFPSAVKACTIVPGALPATAGVIGAAGIFVAQQVTTA
jgi:glucokinase